MKNSSDYTFNKARYGTHRLIAEELGEGKVLDVGCNKGYLGRLAKGSDFYGIDWDRADLKTAKKAGYKEVYELDLNQFHLFKANQKFDFIVFGDILEHLLKPKEVLNFFVKKHLAPGGKIIISLPNIANFLIRLNLLLGKLNYTESGILDKTHLHFYTLKTARDFVKSSGVKIIKEKFSSNNFGWLIKQLPFLGPLLGFNLIFVCQKG